jgi:hypothetical protein
MKIFNHTYIHISPVVIETEGYPSLSYMSVVKGGLSITPETECNDSSMGLPPYHDCMSFS